LIIISQGKDQPAAKECDASKKCPEGKYCLNDACEKCDTIPGEMKGSTYTCTKAGDSKFKPVNATSGCQANFVANYTAVPNKCTAKGILKVELEVAFRLPVS
jgi:hypothetical protein